MNNTVNQINLAVLLGGEGAERDVSLDSGARVLTALQNIGINAIAIDCPTNELALSLHHHNIQHCFIALHGASGENGTVQALLDTLDISYTGSGLLGSAIAMDKIKTKLIWQSIGIPTPPFMVVEQKTLWSDVMSKVGNKVIIKPVSEGSSVGMSIVDDADTFQKAIALASQYNSAVIAEKWIDGAEYTIGILAGRALPSIRLEAQGEFYDYHAKYLSDTTQYLCPSDLSKNQEIALASQSLQAFNILGCEHYGRVDFMLDESSTPFFLEVNTLPGLTSHSLLPMAAAAEGVSFDQLVLEILKGSLDA